jgi:hypothetical protein
MPHLSTFADLVPLHYGLACECPKCGRSVRLNLTALIMLGKGDRHVHRTRPRGTSCCLGLGLIDIPDVEPRY